MTNDQAISSALVLLRVLSLGKTYTLKSGYTIGMSEEGHIGFVLNDKVSLFSEIPFSSLVSMCKEEEIIPIVG